MNDYRKNRPRRDTLEDIRKGDRFSDFLFVSWGIIEMTIDEAILVVYQFSSMDLRSEPLLELSFKKKLDLLIKIGLLTKNETTHIRKYQEKRNQLFHQGMSIVNIWTTEKEEIMDLGMLAVDASYKLIDAARARFSQGMVRLVTDDGLKKER